MIVGYSLKVRLVLVGIAGGIGLGWWLRELRCACSDPG